MKDTGIGGAPGPDDRAAFEAIIAAPELASLADRPEQDAGPSAAESDAGPSPDAADGDPQPAPRPAPQPEPQPAAAQEPPPPDPPEKPKFPLAKLEPLGLAMTVAMAASGQILFWREFFGGGLGGTVAAVGIAAAFEIVMVGATSKALFAKSEQSPGWGWGLAAGTVAAGGSALVQILHWEPRMGIAFALASLIGWAVHAWAEWTKAQRYVNQYGDYEAERARLRRKAEARADAAYERQLAEYETRQQASDRAVATAEADRPKPARPARKPSEAKAQSVKPAKAGTGKEAPGKAAAREESRREALRWSAENGHPGPSAVREHLRQVGHQVPGLSTLRGWLNQGR